MPPSGRVEDLAIKCRSIPDIIEWREWLAVFAEAAYVNDAARLCAFIRWRWRGSKLEELPPGVPSPAITAPIEGPGTELAKVIAEFAPGCGNGLCGEWIAKMNAWGIAGCREHREEIIDRLEQAASEVNWFAKTGAICILLTKPWFDKRPWATRREQLGSIHDEALRRAERS